MSDADRAHDDIQVGQAAGVNDHGDIPWRTTAWSAGAQLKMASVAKNASVLWKIPAKKWGDTEIAERGRSALVMRARYRSAGLTPHQRGWTDAG